MNYPPLSPRDLFLKLKQLDAAFVEFTKSGTTKLTAEEVQLMQSVYPSVLVLARGSMAQTLNVTCVPCIREAFHVFTSLYNRYKLDPDINEDFESKSEQPPVDYDLLFEQLKNAWKEKEDTLPEGKVINTDAATRELDTIIQAIKDAPEREFNAAHFIDWMADNYISDKPRPVELPAAAKAEEAPVIVEPEPAKPVIVKAPVVVPTPEHIANEPAVEGVPLNTEASLTPQQKAAITKKKNAEAAAAAKAEEAK